MRKQLRLATWNVSGLCSERKQKEIADLLACNSIDIVAVQESWEKEDSKIDVDGYKWFGKPRTSQRSQRGEGGVGFLVRECLVSEVEFITTVAYEESVWMKVRGERGRLALCIGCVYMPTDSTNVAVLDNGRQLVSEPEWTRVRPSLDQKSVIDYILMDEQLMAVSGNVIVDSTDIGCSDHFLVWMEIGRVTKRGEKVKRVLRRWRLERFDDVKVRVTYQKALQAEVLGFTESISQKVESGMKGEPLVQEVVHEWEDIVNRVTKSVVGEKTIVCGQLDGGIMK